MSLYEYQGVSSPVAELNGNLQELHELTSGLNRCRTTAEIARYSMKCILQIRRVSDGWIELHDIEGRDTTRPRQNKSQAQGAASGPAPRCDEGPIGARKEITSVPLIIAGRSAGTLNLRGSGPSGAFSEDERKTIVNIANQISNALERAQLYESLERKVQERTGDLMKAAKVKDEFLAMVSHELRTPLTSINAAVALLHAEKFAAIPPQVRTLVELAHNNGIRLLRIVNDLIDLTRISSGTFELKMEQVELGPILVQVVDSKRINPEFRATKITLLDRTDCVFVDADPPRIQQVIDNLISNAVKFSDPHTQLEIAADRLNKNVRVSVADKGIGIPDEFQTLVFEPFTQVDSSSTRSKGGIGLGLSIAKAIVEAHRGKIGFTSKPGKGSTFYFELPIAV
jgi:signal transduction histidine kinase